MSKEIKEITMNEVFGRGEDYYTKEYQNNWRKDFDLLERITKDCTKEELERIYDMINGETYEIMDMVQYLSNNKN